MNNYELCLALMKADTEETVISELEDAGLWSDKNVWRYLGDAENNFSSIGNQQSEAVAALVEKVINGLDARLINASMVAGVNPESSEAPTSIPEAVAKFFERKEVFKAESDGRIALWSNSQATSEGRLLTVAATGAKPPGRPCISVADQGEGQTPDNFPHTFLSLLKSNKFRIHFVQGKFNMGGTGALNFCSDRHRLQLIVSRRNPSLLPANRTQRDEEWGFTIVRRQKGEAGARSSVFTYLAPVDASGSQPGNVPSFRAAEFPIFPEDPKVKDNGADAYARSSPYGTLVKLYEYDWQGGKSNIVFSAGGLLTRIDLALPELALPVRLFECRIYKGGLGSFSTNALGLVSRLERDRAENLESEFPVGAKLMLEGKPISVRVYAFRPGKAEQYRLRSYGVIFSVNGQMHAAFPTDLFRRKAVNLSYIADSLLVVVDCSGVNEVMREDLFMNSRDRLKNAPLSRRLEEELVLYLNKEPALRSLQNRRREERTAERLMDDRPLADVLQGLLKSNPILSKLFSQGMRLSAPFPPTSGTGPGSKNGFEGKAFPTYFRFKGRKDSESLKREAQLGTRIRLSFETDAEDDYFIRTSSPGAWRVLEETSEGMSEAPDSIATGPRSGIAQVWLALPKDAQIGSTHHYVVEVTDDSRIEAISNHVTLSVVPKNEGGGGGSGSRSKVNNRGKGSSGAAGQLALPPIIEVKQEDWDKEGFNETSALKVVLSNSDKSSDSYDFFINVDNRYLKISQKERKSDPELLRKQFVYGLVLVGLALLQGHRDRAKQSAGQEMSADDEGPEGMIASATSALAPVFLPMLEAIGGLSFEED